MLFRSLGNYTVSLTATNAVGNNTHTKTNYIQVNTANADFTANPTTVVVNYSTVFTDASTCNVSSWAWDFGSGASPATASTQGPHTVTYSTLGQKNVTLTVNGTIVQTKNNYINVIADNFTMSNTPVTTCSGNYYDPGGPSAAYGNNLDFTQTFYPAVTGNNIRVIFNSFALEANANCSYDYLKIYNGPNTSSPLLGTWCGNNSPGTQTANNAAGALTFVFHSDNTITAAGWAATISCVGGASVNNPASLSATPVDPNQINLTWALNAGNDNIILAWSPTPSFGTPVNGTQYIAGSTLPGGGTVLYNGNATAYNHTGLTPATTYYYKAFSYNPAINYSTGITANAATPAVTLSVAPANQNVTAPAGNTTFAITSNAAWTAVSDQTWCTVTPSGTGNATLTATFTENTAVTQRIANITVTAAGASTVTVTVTQAGAAPTLAVTPPNQNVSANAGACTFNVASNTNWTAVSSATWCTVTAAGSGNGTLTASYTENTSLSPRVATLTVTVTGLAPVNVTVSQEGAAPYLSVTPSNQNVSAPAGAIAYNVSSNAGWTASSDQTWCTVTPAGTGNGTLTADYLENTYTVQRIANITVIVSGIPPVTVTLTQGGTAPYLTVTPDNQNTGATAGSATYSVGCNQTWSANSNASWCQVTASGNGSGNLMADFTENLSTETRIATLTVTSAGLTPVNVTLTQAGAAPYLSIQPASQTVNPAAGTTLYNITSNASWVAASDAEWCAVTPAGTGNASLTADYEENTTADIRTANISVSVINLPVQVVQLIQLPYTIGIPQDASDFRLYPNPTTGRFIIAGPGTLPFRFQMNIYDENGRCVASDSRKGQNAYAIDLSGQAPGVYTVRAEVDGRELNWKIILK